MGRRRRRWARSAAETRRRTANAVAGGGGTFVLNLPQGLKSHPKEVARLNGMGYDVHAISSWEGIVAFARAFSRKHYEEALRAK